MLARWGPSDGTRREVPIACLQVCKWIGNSPQVAKKHYLQTTEEHFERALQGGAKCGAQEAQMRRSRDTHQGARTRKVGWRTAPKSLESVMLCRVLRRLARICQKAKRKCMGIEPTYDAVYTPYNGFEDRGDHQICKHLHRPAYTNSSR